MEIDFSAGRYFFLFSVLPELSRPKVLRKIEGNECDLTEKTFSNCCGKRAMSVVCY